MRLLDGYDTVVGVHGSRIAFRWGEAVNCVEERHSSQPGGVGVVRGNECLGQRAIERAVQPALDEVNCGP